MENNFEMIFVIKKKIRKMGVTQKEKKTRIYRLCNQLRKIKNDLLNVETTNYKSHAAYHEWINQHKQWITPNKASYKQNAIVYDSKCSPFDYFPCMVFMMKEVEKEEETMYV